MAINRAHLTSMQATAEWLAANVPILSSVTYETGLITVKNATNNTVFKFDNTGSGYLRGFITSSVYEQVQIDNFIMNNVDAIACDNGCILEFASGTNKKAAVLFAMSNSGQIACIYSYGGTSSKAYLKSEIHHVARGDSETISTTTTFTPEAQQQTSFATFCTNADAGVASYTPKAFYMPVSQVYGNGIGKFIIGADTYITNGYWAIKDGGAT